MQRVRGSVAVLALILASCGGSGGETVVVSAASSLTDAFTAIATTFEESHPGVEVILNFGSSTSLAEQVDAGAPVDVFASADPSNVERLGDLLADTHPFATNGITIAVTAGNPFGVVGLEDLAREDLVVGLCALGVPCGDLARAVIADAGVVPSVDTGEPNVRSLVTKIAAGEVDVGLVYTTDLDVSGVTGVDVASTRVTEYWIATVRDARNPSGAAAFMAFVLSEEGRAILTGYGFGAP